MHINACQWGPVRVSPFGYNGAIVTWNIRRPRTKRSTTPGATSRRRYFRSFVWGRRREQPMVDVQAVADYILASVDVGRGDSITNLKLQKLVYYCQAWHLVERRGPLFIDAIEAWPHGPVVYAVWKRFSGNQWHAIDTEANADLKRIATIPADSAEVIDHVLSAYSHLSAVELEEATHLEDPWTITRGGLSADAPSNLVITHGLMQDFYSRQQ